MNHRHSFWLFNPYALGVVLMSGVLGCGEGSNSQPTEPIIPGGQSQVAGAGEAKSQKQRLLNPTVAAPTLAKQVRGNTQFALDLYKVVRAEKENFFFSPHSISVAIAMTYAGARGDTEAELAKVLHYDLAQSDLHTAFNALDLALNSRGQGSKAADGQPFRLNVVNAIWGQYNYKFLTPYLDVIALNYGAGLQLLDFRTQTETSRGVINQWVEEKTEKRITNLLPEGTITEDTRLVLTNAVYFNAAWAVPFEKSLTLDKPFHQLDGTTKTVATLSGEQKGQYAKGAGFELVELPYDGQELSMGILLPENGKFDATEQLLDATVLQHSVAALKSAKVQIALPKFELNSTLPVKKFLATLGVTKAFDENADFSGMDGTKKLYISDVLHKAFVKINEAGTEAAAATAVVVNERTSVDTDPPIVVTVDRPFIVYIRDHQTNALLFVGRIVEL